MPQESKVIKISKKEIFAKSIVYRVCTVLGESALASILIWFGLSNLFLFIAVVNTIKVLAYFLFDLSWFKFLRGLNLVGRLKRWLGLDNQVLRH